MFIGGDQIANVLSWWAGAVVALLAFVTGIPAVIDGIKAAFFTKDFVSKYFSGRTSKYVKVYDQLKEYDSDYLANKYQDLFEREMIKKYAKYETGIYISNYLIQVRSYIICAVMIFIFYGLFNLFIAATDSTGEIIKFIEVVCIALIVLLFIIMILCLFNMVFNVSSVSKIKCRIEGLRCIGNNQKIAPVISRQKICDIVSKYNGYCLVDARSFEEFRDSGLDGAINAEEFGKNAIAFRDVPIFVYSGYGKRSTELVVHYCKHGYDSNSAGIYNLGGIYPEEKLFQRLAIQLNERLQVIVHKSESHPIY